MAKLRVDHGPIDPDILDNLTAAEKDWLRSWNREAEFETSASDAVADSLYPNGVESVPGMGTDTGGTADSSEYDDLTNEELKDLLRDRELPVSGKHDELVARLVADDEAEDDEDDDDEE